jgi:hypothetical protein
MNLARLRPWQWLLTSIVLGFTLGSLASVGQQYAAPDYGETINGDRDFERALTSRAPAVGPGARVFSNLVVYPARIAGDDGPRTVHVVSGEYTGPGGGVRRRSYVAAIPFRLVRSRSAGGTAEYASVREYLDGLSKQGVTYRYAWWHEPRWVVPAWTAGTVVVVGLLLPALVNYLTYGTLHRPPEEKDVDLSAAAATPPASRSPSVGTTDLEGYSGDDGAVDDGAQPAAPAAAPVAPAPLAAPPLEVAAVEPAGAHSYDAGPEDFYPTERKARPGNR